MKTDKGADNYSLCCALFTRLIMKRTRPLRSLADGHLAICALVLVLTCFISSKGWTRHNTPDKCLRVCLLFTSLQMTMPQLAVAIIFHSYLMVSRESRKSLALYWGFKLIDGMDHPSGLPEAWKTTGTIPSPITTRS